MEYKCALCSYNTNKKYNITRHHNTKHKNIPINKEIKEKNKKEIKPKIKEEIKDEYIYLLQEREFIRTNEPIYKIGKTKQECLKRICNYPNGTKLLIQILCNDCDKYERLLINKFKELFIHKQEIGNEYFKGNHYKMIETIYNLVWEFDIKNKKDNEIKNVNQCSKCNKILSSQQYLQKHLLICNGVLNPLECHYCHKIFSCYASKSKHLKICKDKLIENKDEYQCSKCNKILSSQQYLQKHLLICKGVSNTLECHYCHKIYASRTSKSNHLKICKDKHSKIENEIEIEIENKIKNENEIENEIENKIEKVIFDSENMQINFDTSHLNNDEIKCKLLTLNEDYIFEYYSNKLFENKNNKIIKKPSLRTIYSLVHVGNDKWIKYMDDMIYPIIISNISKLLLLNIDKKELTENNKKKYKYNINMLKLLFN